jgi:hypothetical protein
MLSEASYHNMTVGRIPSVEGGIQPTIVDAKGDLIAAVAADSLNRLAVGSNDQVLVADSAASTGLAWKSYATPFAAGKNGWINGGMDIWQRGTTSASITTSIVYAPDRWGTISGASTGTVVSRQLTNDTTNLPSIQYCARVARTSGQTGTSLIQFAQSMESVNSVRFAGKSVTLSFYARAGANYSSASNALNVLMLTGTGTDQQALVGYTGSVSAINSFATLTTTWQRFSFTVTLANNVNEIGADFYYTPSGTAGANDYFEITGIQLEEGSVATPFSRAGGTIQGELAACQRYYFRATPGGIYSGYASGMATTTTVSYSYMAFPVQMRITPTSIDYSNIGFGELQNGIVAATSVNLGYAGTASIFGTLVQVNVASGLVQYRAGIIANTNNTAGYLGLSAEL